MKASNALDDEFFRETLPAMLSNSGVPGASFAAFSGGSRADIQHGGAGRNGEAITLQSRYPIGCLIKLLVAVIILQYHESGRLGLDEPISSYLPELRGGWSGNTITARHLLTHTAGYREPEERTARWNFSWERFVEHVQAQTPEFSPGEIWSYTQSGPAILAIAIERISGKSVFQEIADRLLSPLSIDADRFVTEEEISSDALLHVRSKATGRYSPIRLAPDKGIFQYSISERRLSPSNVLLLMQSLLQEHTNSIVSPFVRRLLTNSVQSIPRRWMTSGAEHVPRSYGLGLAHYGSHLGQNGSYVGTTLGVRIDPQAKWGFAVGLSAWVPYLRDNLLQLAADRVQPCCSAQEDVDFEFTLDELVGEYDGLMLGMGSIRITGDGLCQILASGNIIDVQLSQDEHGLIRVSTDSPFVALGFSRRRDSREVIVHFGQSAFKRRA